MNRKISSMRLAIKPLLVPVRVLPLVLGMQRLVTCRSAKSAAHPTHTEELRPRHTVAPHLVTRPVHHRPPAMAFPLRHHLVIKPLDIDLRRSRLLSLLV